MPGTPRRHSRTEQTRRQILTIAEGLFAERGFSRTRLEDVGEAMGVGRSTVLYHFNDKRELYRSVLSDVFGGLLADLRGAISSRGSLPERVEAAVSALVDYVGARPAAARIALRESVTTDEGVLRDIRAQASPLLVLLDLLFEEGERSGVFAPGRSDAYHFASAIAGATLFYIAALPTFVAELPYDPLCPEELGAHKRDVIRIARRLLRMGAPTSVPT